jgi:predicted unusual protein kinase regulating ubiquinone biosynthesis (AarF/ABC1/UbiB family)
LTTTRLAGDHIETWLSRNPSQQQRDCCGQMLVDLFHHSVFVTGVLHADPNFGNYLFGDAGQLGLIDFGCVKRLDSAFAGAMQRLIEADRLDPDATEALHRNLGVRYRSDVPRAALGSFLSRWGTWIAEPYRTASFDFTKSGAYFERSAQMGRELYDYLERYEGAFLYFGRAHHGLLRLLQRLGATVSMVPNEHR